VGDTPADRAAVRRAGVGRCAGGAICRPLASSQWGSLGTPEIKHQVHRAGDVDRAGRCPSGWAMSMGLGDVHRGPSAFRPPPNADGPPRLDRSA